MRAETGRHGAVALLFEQPGAFALVDLPKDRGTALMTAGMDHAAIDRQRPTVSLELVESGFNLAPSSACCRKACAAQSPKMAPRTL